MTHAKKAVQSRSAPYAVPTKCEKHDTTTTTTATTVMTPESEVRGWATPESMFKMFFQIMAPFKNYTEEFYMRDYTQVGVKWRSLVQLVGAPINFDGHSDSWIGNSNDWSLAHTWVSSGDYRPISTWSEEKRAARVVSNRARDMSNAADSFARLFVHLNIVDEDAEKTIRRRILLLADRASLACAAGPETETDVEAFFVALEAAKVELGIQC